MKPLVMTIAVASLVALVSTAHADEDPQVCAQFASMDAGTAQGEDRARVLARFARTAESAGCLTQADELLVGALKAHQSPPLVYQRILLREKMRDYSYALGLLDAYRNDLLRDPTITDVQDTEARLNAALKNPPPEEPVILDGPAVAVPRKRSTLDTVGPIVLAALGGAAIGLAVYGFLAPCDIEAEDGTCLVGQEPDAGVVLGYSAAGVLALSTAAIWWIIAIPPRQSGPAVAVTPTAVLLRF